MKLVVVCPMQCICICIGQTLCSLERYLAVLASSAAAATSATYNACYCCVVLTSAVLSIALLFAVFCSAYRRVCRLRKDVIYQAIWAENASFDQILVSPTMFSDHMPTVMFSALTMVSQAACLFCLAADYH